MDNDMFRWIVGGMFSLSVVAQAWSMITITGLMRDLAVLKEKQLRAVDPINYAQSMTAMASAMTNMSEKVEKMAQQVDRLAVHVGELT